MKYNLVAEKPIHITVRNNSFEDECMTVVIDMLFYENVGKKGNWYKLLYKFNIFKDGVNLNYNYNKDELAKIVIVDNFEDIEKNIKETIRYAERTFL